MSLNSFMIIQINVFSLEPRVGALFIGMQEKSILE